MSSLFFIICAASLVFFTVFLLECWQERHKASKQPIILKIVPAEVVDSTVGRRFLVHLEKEMAEFVASHSRISSLLLVAAVLLAVPNAAHGQRALPTPTPGDADEQVSPAVQKQLDAMQKRIEQLEAELNNRKAEEQPSVEAANNRAPSHSIDEQAGGTQAPTAEGALQQTGAPEKKGKPDPFSFADFTWLNGNSRIKEVPFQTPFFTPEIRADISYIYEFAHPRDDTIGGSSEVFRTNEFQVTQLGVGGDFQWDNVRARLMTQFGMYSQTTPRNDASPARGQWTLADAYRYISEAYGGYHFNVLDGINVDAGIFMSYIGLFSYYNFDNWAYQPSYVLSNTPWFFNGLRVQIFPNEHLKIEPWLINGWQAYGRFNYRPGIGAQILWRRPNGSFEALGNQYILGEDTLGVPGRVRYHTDDSIQWKYYDHPDRTLDKMAFSLTGDMGCEHGGGVSCAGDSAKGPKQSFLGYMFLSCSFYTRL